MAQQDFSQILTEFAEFVGMKDKEIAKLIGNLTTLNTTEKTTLTGAINELYQSVKVYQAVRLALMIVQPMKHLLYPLRKSLSL